MKFFNKHSNKFYLIGSLFLLIMIGIMSLLIYSHFNEPVRAAAETWTLTVNKTSALDYTTPRLWTKPARFLKKQSAMQEETAWRRNIPKNNSNLVRESI